MILNVRVDRQILQLAPKNKSARGQHFPVMLINEIYNLEVVFFKIIIWVKICRFDCRLQRNLLFSQMFL